MGERTRGNSTRDGDVRWCSDHTVAGGHGVLLGAVLLAVGESGVLLVTRHCWVLLPDEPLGTLLAAGE